MIQENTMFEIPFKKPLPETSIAIKAAVKASEAVMEVYKGEFHSTLKNNNEPLTEADLKSNTIIQNILSKSQIPILSEESPDDLERLKSHKVWIIDPLDGTTDFVNKTGEFTIMIALVENSKPILGVISRPSENTLYLSEKNNGAYKIKNGSYSSLSVSAISDLTACRVVGSRFHRSEDEKKLLELIQPNRFTSRGSSLKVADICSGLAELYFTTTDKIKQWDTCASYCLITESGGKMTDMLGGDIQYNSMALNHKNGLLVTNGLIHEKVIKINEKFREESP